MFEHIQEGLEVYKRKVKEHLQKINEVAKREMKNRSQRGLDYYGISDWPQKDYKEFMERNYQLGGMVIALSLTKGEVKTIWEDIEKELGIRK